MAQMCEVCRALPDDFSVLSGDDLFTVPLMAVGGAGVVSVASNEVPAEMARLVSLARAGDFAARPPAPRAAAAADAGQLRRVQPHPVKAAMAHLGLLEPHYRLPMAAPRPASLERIVRVLDELGVGGGTPSVEASA